MAFFFKGLVTPHNAYCQTGGGGGLLPLLFSVGISDRSNKYLVVLKLETVNAFLLTVRQKTLWCVIGFKEGSELQEKKQKKKKKGNNI